MRILSLVLVILVLVACTNPAEEPAPTSEARLQDGNMPKIIATVDMAVLATETPTADNDPSTTSVADAVTPTPGISPTPTWTPTPYVGIFLGEPTVISPDGEISLPPTIAPLVGQPNTTGGVIPPPQTGIVSSGNCAIPVANAFAGIDANLGCPVDGGTGTTLVTQIFERGRMFWRDTRQIIVLGNNNTFWRVTDSWNEGIPDSDPNLNPPAGLQQPVRGFGLVWRDNAAFRDTLGWAQGGEFPISSTWQEFEGGTLFVGDNNQTYVIPAGGTGQYTVR